MNTEREFLDYMWRRMSGLPELVPRRIPDLDKLKQSECCPEFEQLMRNRLVMGAFRYGLMCEQDFSKYDLIDEARKRIDRYEKDGNLEHLVDAGNMVQLKFYWERKNGGKFEPIDDGEHAERIK